MAVLLNVLGLFSFFQGSCCPLAFSPFLLFILTSIWFLLHRFLSPLLPLYFLPAAARAVHREKWRRWKQLHVSQTQWGQCSKVPGASEIPQKSLHAQPDLDEKKKDLQISSPPRKQLPETMTCHSQGEKESAHLGKRGEKNEEIREVPITRDITEEQRHKDEVLKENPRPSEVTLEMTKNACGNNDQTWTLLSRDDAKEAAIDEGEKREENMSLLRRRLVGSVSGEAAEMGGVSAGFLQKKDVDERKAEKSALLINEKKCCSEENRGREDAGKEVEETSSPEESGILAAAGTQFAAAAQEGAAAVGREGPEEAAAGGEGEKTADVVYKKRDDDVDNIKLERQSLEKYFVMANANVIGMLHALYLTPAALYYSIRNVVLPAAELVLAERAAASTTHTKPVGHAHTTQEHTTVVATDVLDDTNQQLSSHHHHMYDLLNTYLLHWEKAPSFWDGSSDCVVIFSAYMMTSYFVWDTVDCFQHYKVHGRAFFFHALLSLLAGILQVSARGIRLAGLCSMFAVSEVSTPFLHFRWFLIQNGLGGSRLCTVTTLWTVFLFILVRAFMVPCLVFSHYWTDLVFYHEHILREDARISVVRALFMLALTVAWTALNLFWCFLFFRTLGRRRSRSSRRAEGEKSSQSLQNCSRQDNYQRNSPGVCSAKTRSAKS